MKILQRAIFCLLFNLYGCHNSKPVPINAKNYCKDLLRNAEDTSQSVSLRLQSATQADSVALKQNDEQLHLDCLLLIAALNLQSGYVDSAWAMFTKGIVLSQKLNDVAGHAVSLSSIGSLYISRGNYDSAIRYLSEAQTIFDSLGNPKKIAQNLVNEGIAYECQGNFVEAFNVDVRAAVILDSLHDTDDFASVSINLGNVLLKLRQFEDALHYQNQALNILTGRHDLGGMALARNNIGDIYRDEKNYQKALESFFAALDIKQQLKDKKEIAITLDNIGQTYDELKDYNKAQQYFTKALNLEIAVKDTEGMMATSNSLAKLYLDAGDLTNALQTAEAAYKLSPLYGSTELRLTNNMILFEVYSKLGKNTEAVMHAKKSFELKDSLLNERIAKEVSLLNTQFKVKQKEEEILFHKKFENSQRIQINMQYAAIVLLAILLFSIMGAALLLRQSNKKIKQAHQKIETLLSELNHRVKNNLQLVVAMLHRQAQMSDNPRQKELTQGNIERIRSLSVVHSLLYRRQFSETIQMKEFLESLISGIRHSYGDISEEFKIEVHIQNIQLDINIAISVALIINELLTNIYKYANSRGDVLWIGINLAVNDNRCTLVIKDNCSIWNFEKVIALKKGLGLMLVNDLVTQLEGKWDVANTDGGTVNTIEFSK